ncbi:ATP-dependent DNA helicase RecG [Synergistales bacterium]|nr:ATP-dependent DNA helicase RecG [Synergistales bacterium]
MRDSTEELVIIPTGIDDQVLDAYLKKFYGNGATFREGQKDAIYAVLSGKRTLVVQKTGWGKSLIYFLSTRILRDKGNGFSLIISPLLALMENQIDAAKKFGLNAATINSQNDEDWDTVTVDIAENKIDVLFISPERLSNYEFRETVLNICADNIGMIVVDEAHCISDWGHDFRPDYRRIVDIIKILPSNVPLLATTATANDRVIKDIHDQMGENIHLLRGSLARDSLYIQVINLKHNEERLAWLSENLESLEGSGVVYCLTVRDCEMVSGWLTHCGISASAYTGRMNAEERRNTERRFFHNEIKALVATVAYGMGVDKPDIAFVIHFQKPRDVIAYYQQIGRAGRNIARAHTVMFARGYNDDEVLQYFIDSAFPKYEHMNEVIKVLENSDDGFSLKQLKDRVNISYERLKHVLKFLEVDGGIYKEERIYRKSPRKWVPDFAYIDRITQIKQNELKRLNDFVVHDGCYMEFLANELNDKTAHTCGHCGNCAPNLKLPETVRQEIVLEAQDFLRNRPNVIDLEKQHTINNANSAKSNEALQPTIVLSDYGDAGWGHIVARDKYENNQFSKELIDASVSILKDMCTKWEIDCVTAIPSLRRPHLVRNFAIAVAANLGLPYSDSLSKIEGLEQKDMNNSRLQFENASKSFAVEKALSGNILLIDDMIDSGWTLFVCAHKLIKSGANKVYPFALANIKRNGG